MTSKVRGLHDFAAQVETFVREKCSSQESGAAASEPSYTHGHEGASVSPRVTQGDGSIAVLSSKGADLTSPAEYEAALCQIEEYPPDIRQKSDNIREERWTHFSLEGVKFPTELLMSFLAIFERDLIIHLQQISKAAAFYVRALLGGVKRALEVYRTTLLTAILGPFPPQKKCGIHTPKASSW